jgi:hypothetical protein
MLPLMGHSLPIMRRSLCVLLIIVAFSGFALQAAMTLQGDKLLLLLID